MKTSTFSENEIELQETELPNGLDTVWIGETESTLVLLSTDWGACGAFGASLEVATGFEENEREKYLRGFQAFLQEIGYFEGIK